MLQCWINGTPSAQVSSTDRGFQYGDGLFETCRVVRGQIRSLDLHLARLTRGCAQLAIPLPDLEVLRHELAMASRDSAVGVLKLIVTRGEGGRGYRPNPGAVPTRWIATYAAPEYPSDWAEHGVEIRTCQTRLAIQPRLAGLKHLNRLEQVCARSEWAEASPQEGLMLDMGGRIVCGTMSNVFAVVNQIWMTPRVDRCGVAGTLRAGLMHWMAAAGNPVREVDLYPETLATADEVFLTNAVFGVWPVRCWDGNPFTVGAAVRQAQDYLKHLT